MRLSIIAALGALALGVIAISGADAAPTIGRAAIVPKDARSAPLQDVRYVVRCHRVRVWRHGQPVLVRRCHRNYY